MQALLQQQLYDLYSRRSRIISKFLSPRATSFDRSRAIYLKCTSNFATRLLFFLPQLRRFDCTRDQRSLLASLFIHPLVSFAIAAFISLCAVSLSHIGRLIVAFLSPSRLVFLSTFSYARFQFVFYEYSSNDGARTTRYTDRARLFEYLLH